ncbi:hypothetical protein [Lachnospira sp.]|jgi:hypothetical protein|uniref:hypothetical protein n=1 Tax=Lachnospira sp. TaxID=2049031 RepID=UPI00257CBDEA|nr:hypothetical protein [Lachnospira sp.]
MVATTIEQSKHLLELGLDPKTADCNWNITFGEWALCVGKNNLPHAVPAWSLSALLEVMRKLNATITLQIINNFAFLRIKDNGFIWQKDIHVKDPMDAVYGGMLWLFEQGLIKKEGQDESTS